MSRMSRGDVLLIRCRSYDSEGEGEVEKVAEGIGV